MTEKEIQNEYNIDRLRRKRDQHYELAGMARQDGDLQDNARNLKIAKSIEKRISELLA